MILCIILRVRLQNEIEPQVIGKSCESLQCKLYIAQIRHEVLSKNIITRPGVGVGVLQLA